MNPAKFMAVKTITTSLALAFSCSQLNAGDNQDKGFVIAPAIGYMSHSASKQGLDDAATASLSLGYQFGNPWAAELTYLRSNPDLVSSGDTDLSQVRLDALYHFSRLKGKTQPYAVFGLGQSDYDLASLDDDDTMANIGFGVKHPISEALSVRTDIRAIRHSGSDVNQVAANLGLHYLIGKSSAGNVNRPSETDRDSDNDGVFDRLDRCPGTAKKLKVDKRGCAVDMDKDGDGVRDDIDQCLDTKKGAKVDAKGCYEVLKENVKFRLNVQFENNSDVLIAGENKKVAELASFLKKFPQTSVEINGHTDNRGSAAYNKNLSLTRAISVINLLSNEFGIEASRLTAIGYGEEKPIASNNTAQGRAANRRVTAEVKAEIKK